MHPLLRVGLTLCAACALALAAPLAFELAGGASAPETFLASLPASAWAWLLGRDLLPALASPGLLLVAGGMLALLVLTLALLLRGALPSERVPAPVPSRRALVAALPPASRPVPPVAYRGPRDEEFRRGRVAGARIDAPTLDDLLDYVVAAEIGRPRILRSIPNLMRLRLDGCRGCADAARHGPAAPGVDGCAFECGLLESSLSRLLRRDVLVHEVACRGRGAAACDFEVWS
jgi:hypothetical protein